MSLHIQRFLDQVRAAESRQQNTVTLTLADARNLHNDLTRLLLKLESSANNQPSVDSVSVVMDGGRF
jgi:hypothetical protein